MDAKKNLEAKHMAMAGSAIAIVVASATFAATAFATMSINIEQAEAETPAVAGHEHAWQKDAELVHHDEVTHTVEHGPVYESVTVPHTICNVCGEVIDGQTAQHRERTGHASFTPDVPLTEQRMVSEAWTETITDEPAYDELVALTETCAECGAVRDLASADAGAGDER